MGTARVLFCLLLLLPFALGAAPAPKHKSLKQLKREHASKKQQRRALAIKKHRIEHKAHVVRADIQEIDSQIGEQIQKLEETQARLHTNQALEKQLTVELDKDTAKLKERSEQARLRLRQIYMHGSSTLASAIVGSKSLAEFSSRKFIFERIAQRDRQLFEEVRQLQQTVLVHKQQVDKLIDRIKLDIDQEQSEKAELQNSRADKAAALQDLKDQEGQIEQLLQELDQEDASIQAQIQAYEAGVGRSMGAFHGRFMPPVFGARLASGFGMRFHPILHRNRMHTGQDFAIGYGTPIHAAADGVVISCRYTRGYGNLVVIDHGGGMSTLYGHCSSFVARPGQRVSKGQVVARVGATGLATGPHVHFEIRVNGRPVNPMSYLR